ncbi:MAG: winged helix-turn-helix transcriptional regulator [Lachnospiraceae bacterium]|nr:winged helix-turn-helix transcriptional regulator [Lachnospiraceae bacterium]
MYEIGQGDEAMHYLEAEQYTHLAGEINSLYHEAAVKMGISDSVQNILYIICEKEGQCLQSEISRMTGISRQTINSAIRKLEKEGIVYLKQGNGRNTIICLSEKGRNFALEKIYPLYEIENKIWNDWTSDERQQYLTLTKKYRDGLKKYLKNN